MDVRRQLARLSNRIRLGLHASPQPASAAAGRERALAGQSPARPLSRRASIVMWMEDARRLRPRPEMSTPSVPEQIPPAALAASRRSLAEVPAVPGNPGARLAAQGPGPQHASAESVTQTVASSASPTAAPLPPDICVDFSGGFSAETLAAIESLDTTQRRLIFLRYLVRQGVYNEGFRDRGLPEQYWRSRGVEGAPQAHQEQ